MPLLVFILAVCLLPGFGKMLKVLTEPANPTIVEAAGDELYILDDVFVYVYSLKDYKLLRKFGKKGEGPGELLTTLDMPITMQLSDKYIILNSFNKIIYFSKSGQMIKERRIPIIAFQVIPFGDNYVVTKFNRDSSGSSKAAVLLFDQDFKEIKKLYENNLLNDMRKGKIAVPLANIFAKCSGDRVFIFDQQRDFIIDVFDLNGKKLAPVTMDYRKLKVNEAFKKKYMDWLKVQPAFKTVMEVIKDMIYFTEYLPVVRNAKIMNQQLIVQTYKMQDQRCEFLMLDLKGNIKKQVFLPGADREQIRPDPAAVYTFQGNTYYYLIENVDEEEWELHSEAIK